MINHSENICSSVIVYHNCQKNHTSWEFIKKSGSSIRFKNCSSRWCEDDMLIPDSNVDENDIFKTELEHLVMGNEILQRDEEC